MRPRLGLFGNCQAREMQRIALSHEPLTRNWEVVPIKPVYEMSMEDREAFCELIPSLDVLAIQFTMEKYAPADFASISRLNANRLIEFPSMWFGGHLPDVQYMKDPRTGIEDYHSPVMVRAFFEGMSVAEAAALYLSEEAIPKDVVERAYQDGIAELKRREQRCEVRVTDLLESDGPGKRHFHTMNHPDGFVVRHALNQLLSVLGVDPVSDAIDGLSFLAWPVTGSVAQRWGIAAGGAVERGPVSVEEFISRRFEQYAKSPEFLTANQHSFVF